MGTARLLSTRAAKHPSNGARGGDVAMLSRPIHNGRVSPTISYDHPDPASRLDCVPNKTREAVLGVVSSNTIEPGSHNGWVVLDRVE